jgi:uncharacterized protein YrrD
MSTLVPATRMIGLPVVTLDGDDLAEIRDVVYDPTEGRVLGFTLNKRGRFGGRLREVIGWDTVVAVGRDAVMVRSPAALASPQDADEELANPPVDRNIVGNRVVTDSGTELGEVVDLIVEVAQHACVVGYEVLSEQGEGRGTRLLVPLPEQLAVSGDALVVPAEVQPFVRDDLSGFGAAVEDFRKTLTRERAATTERNLESAGTAAGEPKRNGGNSDD